MDVVTALLPRLFDPLFDYLEDNLPPTLYNAILNALSYSITLAVTAVRLIGHLLQKDPSEWDAQTVLPPIITILAAYLALASLYRTTSWLFRLTFWFIKWGSLIGILSMGVGWMAAVNSLNGEGTAGLADLGSKAAAWFNGNGNVPTGGGRTRPRSEHINNNRPWSRYESTNKNLPRQGPAPANEEAEKIMQGIIEAANKVFDSSWWWNGGTGAASGQQEQGRNGRSRSR